ncbi:hypothetical protein bthur0001_54990 [Bacillus thuringiensis serovar tochigiensis BGSC 4Y1]|nr:hypothetical protein bthur0001_54990 [Bacillus thuringiensis serovar tochigiensis BGSC 4Y1]
MASTFQKTIRSSYLLDKVIEDAIDILPGTMIAVISIYNHHFKEIEKPINKLNIFIFQLTTIAVLLIFYKSFI